MFLNICVLFSRCEHIYIQDTNKHLNKTLIPVQINDFYQNLINSMSSASEPMKSTNFSIFNMKTWIQVFAWILIEFPIVLEKLLECSNFPEKNFSLCQEKLKNVNFHENNRVYYSVPLYLIIIFLWSVASLWPENLGIYVTLQDLHASSMLIADMQKSEFRFRNQNFDPEFVTWIQNKNMMYLCSLDRARKVTLICKFSLYKTFKHKMLSTRQFRIIMC